MEIQELQELQELRQNIVKYSHFAAKIRKSVRVRFLIRFNVIPMFLINFEYAVYFFLDIPTQFL